MNTLDFAAFDVNELAVLDATDAVALPDMGASVVIIFANYTPDGEEILTEDTLNGSGSLSTSSSCC